MHYEDISIVVIGYDPYIDVWNHYFELLNQYWKDRPKTYLITNEVLPEYDNVCVYAAGKDAEWSRKVQLALEKVSTKYFILLLEDFFTTSYVNHNDLSSVMEIIRENSIDYCKLLNQSKIKGKPFAKCKYLHIIEQNEEYGISLQPAIWERKFLSKLVGNENYNAWLFEFRQVKNKVQNQERINCIADDRNLLKITHAVVQSLYLPTAIKTFYKQGYIIDTSHRRVMSKKNYRKYCLKQWIGEYSPKWMYPLLKKIGRMMKVDFVSDRELGDSK